MKEDDAHPLSLYVSVSSGKSLFVLVLYELDKLDEFFSVLVLKEIIIIIIIIPEIIFFLLSHTEPTVGAFRGSQITEPTEQRMPSSMLEWLSRDGGRR